MTGNGETAAYLVLEAAVIPGAALDEGRLDQLDAVLPLTAAPYKREERPHYGDPKNRPWIESLGKVMR